MFYITKKYVFVVVFAFVFVENNNAQSTISTRSILATAKNKNNVLLQERKIETMANTSYLFPLIDKVGIQTETDRFQLQRQEYTGRVWFNGLSESKTQNQRKQTNLMLERAQRSVLFQDVLFDRYVLLEAYRHAQKSLDMSRRLSTVFADKRAILQRMAILSPEFNVEDLIKAEQSAFDFQEKTLDAEGSMHNISHYWQRIVNAVDSLQLDTTGWIPLSMVRRLVTELPNNALKNPQLARQEARISLLQADYEIEKAQDKKILDYAQVKNQTRSNKDFVYREWSVGLGFLIPFRGSSKVALGNLALQKVEEENKLQNTKADMDDQIFKIRQDLNLIFQTYDAINQQIADSQTTYSMEQYAKVQGAQPLVLLRMQELILQRQAKLIALEHSAFQNYLSLLNLSGKLSELPLVNYLSAGLEAF